jgi:ankyrin repeat protein
MSSRTVSVDDPVAAAAVEAIRAGRVDELRGLLGRHPWLATARIDGARTLLHVATDWPGHHPNGPATVAALVAAGADVDAPFAGGAHRETPLHWAASSDDVAVLDALLDAGADIEATGAVIGGGTSLHDAVAFAQWRAARRLVERGARTQLWDAAALGLVDRVEAAFVPGHPLCAQDVTEAFWAACHGGQRATAELLLERGADPDWVGYDGLTPLEAARRSGADDVVAWLAGR